MKWSKYNYLFQKENHFLIYNSLSNSFAELDNELFDVLSHFKVGEHVSIDDTGLEECLTKMKALVLDDLSEIEKIKYTTLLSRFNPNKLSLTINPTLACNFACPYCFEYEHYNKYMNKEVEDKIITFIKSKSNVKSLHVTWFGGEPLLAFTTIESLSHKMLSLGLNYSSGMISNGYLITKYMAQKFESLHINSIQITLDGLEETHNKRRALKNGVGTFKRILESIEILTKYAPKTRINIRVNIDKENQSEYIKLHQYFTEKFNNTVRISPAFTSDPTEKGTGCLYNPKEKHEFLVNMVKKHGIVPNSFYPGSQRTECAIRSIGAYVIGPEGELYGCWNDVGNPNRVYGKLGDKTMDESKYIAYKMRADALTDTECNDCILFPVCNGGCPYDRIKMYESGLKSETCPLMKTNLKDYLWIHYLLKTNRSN
ncbi:MAG: radical SAM protein [Paramuribaculum sp.]|nr:radical SAM protein [Paramuribaculum sp.]